MKSACWTISNIIAGTPEQVGGEWAFRGIDSVDHREWLYSCDFGAVEVEDREGYHERSELGAFERVDMRKRRANRLFCEGRNHRVFIVAPPNRKSMSRRRRRDLRDYCLLFEERSED